MSSAKLPSTEPTGHDPNIVLGLAGLVLTLIGLVIPSAPRWLDAVLLCGAVLLTLWTGTLLFRSSWLSRFGRFLVNVALSPTVLGSTLLAPVVVAPSTAENTTLEGIVDRLDGSASADPNSTSSAHLVFECRTTSELLREAGAPFPTMLAEAWPRISTHPDLVLHVTAIALFDCPGIPIGTRLRLEGVLDHASLGTWNDLDLLLSDCSVTTLDNNGD